MLTANDVRTATDILSRLTEYLRDTPDPGQVLTLMEPLLDEYTGLPIQLGDTLRAFARAVLDHPDTPHSAALHTLIAELRTAAWQQTDQYDLHYTLDELKALLATAPEPEGCSCR
ncbi:hypothetical protein [Streptomyces poonensis]|uniref:hypothetical protein n=1 Tax=Streptomyces poonensis TaxID=68255 RepID=UPI001E3DAE03|nr:hypothetical protein [Streptomyces poonensis]